MWGFWHDGLFWRYCMGSTTNGITVTWSPAAIGLPPSPAPPAGGRPTRTVTRGLRASQVTEGGATEETISEVLCMRCLDWTPANEPLCCRCGGNPIG